MDTKILNKLSELIFCGFYDPSKQMVTVHFFNETNNKPDIIAYLLKDMTWDVREIVDEVSELQNDKEIITIHHKLLGIEDCDSQFNSFVRLGVTKFAQSVHGDDANLLEKDIMFRIFEDNSYNNI